MNTDKLRDEFEAWAFPEPIYWGSDYDRFPYDGGNRAGEYKNKHLQREWEAWKEATRRAYDIDLAMNWREEHQP